MKKIILRLLLYLFLLVAAAFVCFYFESYYQQMIRNFYELFSFHRISFHTPAKFMRFTRYSFIFSFWLFIVFYYHFLEIRKTKPVILKNLLPSIITGIFLMLICYIDASIKLASCTQCVDGRIELSYYDPPYDFIFILSLTIGTIPLILVLFSAYFKTKNKKI